MKFTFNVILNQKGIWICVLVFIVLVVICCIAFPCKQTFIVSCLSLIIALVAIFVTYQTCYKTMEDNTHSLNLEFKKEEIARIQQELANRFEKFSPNELVSYSLFKDVPTKDQALKEVERLQILFSRCSNLLVSANLLYNGDSKHPEAKVFLKSYDDLMTSVLWFITFSLSFYGDENRAKWKDNLGTMTLGVCILTNKNNDAIDKAKAYINVLNKDFDMQYEVKISNIFGDKKTDITDIKELLKKQNQLEDEEESEAEDIKN